jgi:membrane protein implicated in regulation of membrane protease activity
LIEYIPHNVMRAAPFNLPLLAIERAATRVLFVWWHATALVVLWTLAYVAWSWLQALAFAPL